MSGRITVSNERYLARDGKPFFLLGDTAWLLLTRLDDNEVLRYLDNRRAKGFNTILFTAVHNGEPDVYGNRAFDGAAFSAFNKAYWRRVDWITGEAEQRGIAVGLLPAWGSRYVANGELNADNCEAYSGFLADLLGAHENLIWVLGGDIKGDVHPKVWDKMGAALRVLTPDNLIAFHPFGRTRSAQWFNDRPWLDINMFQSGHRRYDQKILPGSDDDPNLAQWFGEDNWRYCAADLALTPIKPTLDAEPSYEDIPQGLHDASEPRWNARDVRRYAWWSALGGACGHVYGHNSIMQMWSPQYKPAYGCTVSWSDALDAPGAAQMHVIADVMLALDGWGKPDQQLVPSNGEKYSRVAAYGGDGYALLYSYTGELFDIDASRLAQGEYTLTWIDPKSGVEEAKLDGLRSEDIGHVVPPEAGRDWALLLRLEV